MEYFSIGDHVEWANEVLTDPDAFKHTIAIHGKGPFIVMHVTPDPQASPGRSAQLVLVSALNRPEPSAALVVKGRSLIPGWAFTRALGQRLPRPEHGQAHSTRTPPTGAWFRQPPL